jgi:two-component system cell cycle response regulator DivK
MIDRTRKLLIVDDNETFLMYMSILLHRMGFKKVIPADNGVDALKLLRIVTPDVVLLDISMPQIDGVTVLRHIKGDTLTSNIPVVMLTIASDRKSYEECQRLGCSGYLTKPVKLIELNNTLYSCMSAHSDCKNRQFLRTPFNKKVTVTQNDMTEELFAVNLSQRGIYIRKKNPFPEGTEVIVSLPLRDEKSTLNLTGTVIYTKDISGEVFKIPPGMAVEFKQLTSNDSTMLMTYITELLTKDIIEEQDELIIKKDY